MVMASPPAPFPKAVRSLASKLWLGLVDLALPPFCAFCRTKGLAGTLPFLCASCERGLPLLDPDRQCHSCAADADPLTLRDGRCLRCRRLRPPYDRRLAAASFDEPLRAMILRWKYGKE